MLTFGCLLKSDATFTVEIIIAKIKIYGWEYYYVVGGKLGTF